MNNKELSEALAKAYKRIVILHDAYDAALLLVDDLDEEIKDLKEKLHGKESKD